MSYKDVFKFLWFEYLLVSRLTMDITYLTSMLSTFELNQNGARAVSNSNNKNDYIQLVALHDGGTWIKYEYHNSNAVHFMAIKLKS